jgi:hypothetical protein
MIQYALRACGGRVEEGAAMLGLPRKGLYLKRLRYGWSRPRARPPPKWPDDGGIDALGKLRED